MIEPALNCHYEQLIELAEQYLFFKFAQYYGIIRVVNIMKCI